MDFRMANHQPVKVRFDSMLPLNAKLIIFIVFLNLGTAVVQIPIWWSLCFGDHLTGFCLKVTTTRNKEVVS